MYFDHVRCPACSAQFDPEKIDGRGGVASCPACGSQLDIKSLFGVSAHLTEADAPEAHIDDLVEGYGASGKAWRTTGGYDPLAGDAPSEPSARRGPAHEGPPPSGRTNQTGLARRPSDDDDELGPEDGASAVLRALRDLKRR
ncbi:MAG: hypothetical protein EA397_15080 [Deltaproteobacteria bacterium]|nr:MAG: hypothetical protein EA397_15080 [Deltaproteobacteria bacterium]